MKIIINHNSKFGTIDNVITPISDIYTLLNSHLKSGTAKKLVDNDNTLMYELTEKPVSNMNQNFEQLLNRLA